MYTEFFCGIGGLACCFQAGSSSGLSGRSSQIPVSIDINRNALAVHELNHSGGRRICKTIESLSAADVSSLPDKLWWMSPPCQPFTRRGQQRDLDDPRSAGFRNMLELIQQCPPENLAMENVPEFQNSDSHRRLVQVLQRSGFNWFDTVFCPTQLGGCNRRRRFYLVASRVEKLGEFTVSDRSSKSQSNSTTELESEVDFGVYEIPEAWLQHYESAIHIVDEESFLAGQVTTNCFTSAYGRSPVHSGSYLQTGQGVRRFTPLEILWQLGFDRTFRLPDWAPEKLWPLTGNTLALVAVKSLPIDFH